MSNQSLTNQKVMIDGFWDNNAIFVQFLGMCPTLATSTSPGNALGMGVATTVVLVGSNILIAMIRNFIPGAVRLPAFIVVIATMVTMVDLSMNAFFHDLHKILGIFIPLIVVNCIILGRAEAFASKNTLYFSAIDGLFTGIGFTLALVILGTVREILGSGQLFGMNIFGADFHSALAFILPPGAFLALGFILVGVRLVNKRLESVRAPQTATAAPATEAA
ncbi:MAG: electron transport complex subunit E [Magnetococcus sp. DMHC-1]